MRAIFNGRIKGEDLLAEGDALLGIDLLSDFRSILYIQYNGPSHDCLHENLHGLEIDNTKRKGRGGCLCVGLLLFCFVLFFFFKQLFIFWNCGARREDLGRKKIKKNKRKVPV
eukprot:Phypoly_transcript_23407.p1 GENE.Phypoly_transcript_23407~~Phypoly_transcript_23407.p1  ORF type:complete len:113 (-),score=16.46 Phypoly_transcript_23407:7-345(-)